MLLLLIALVPQSTQPPVFIHNAESLCSQVYSKSHGTANVGLSARSNSKLSCNPIAYFYTEDCVCGFRITILKKERRKQAKKKECKEAWRTVPAAIYRVAKAFQELKSINYPQSANTKVNTVLTQFLAGFEYGINIQTKVLESLQ